MSESPSNQSPPRPTPATDHVRSQDQSLTLMLGEWVFKLLFSLFVAAASLLSLLAPRR